MAGSPRFLVLDACVLIDFLESDRSILIAIRDHLGEISVVRPVFDEVDSFSEEQAVDLGLHIVDVELDLAIEAANRRGSLSFEDRLCLLLAAREGWTCVTNDGALRKACIDDDVEVRWGLEVLLDLVRAGGLGKREAESIAATIRAQNPHYVTTKIFAAFVAKLKKC